MPGVRIVAVEPAASPVLSGGEPGFHKIQGIGAGFVPEILDRERLRRGDHASPTPRPRACTRRLAREEGHPGRHLVPGRTAARRCEVARELGPGKIVVTVFCDTGERYLTTDLFHAEGI